MTTTRRDFLRTSAAAGAAAAANLALLSNVHAAGSDEIRVGIIGCGGRGAGAADNVLHAAPNVKVVAIGDVFKFRVNDMRKHLGRAAKDPEIKKLNNGVDLTDDRCFVGLDCHEKVINSGINYVILTSPPGFRPVHLEAAVNKGLNVFTEKPVSVDGPGTRKVLAAYEEAKKKNLFIVAGTQRRHQAPYIETIRQVHDGVIGEIMALRCFWNQGNIWFRPRSEIVQRGEPDTDLAYQMHNWYHFLWVCGDHICEQHVHNIDVCNWAMGDKHPMRCVGVGARSGRPAGDPKVVGNIYDQFALDFEYDGGVHMFSMCRQIGGSDGNIPGVSGVSEAIVGTKGLCQADRYTINGKRLGTRTGTDPYVQEHTDLIECIRNGKPINELKTVAESTLTAIMGRMAAYTGKAVTWEKALNSTENTMPEKLAWDMSIDVPAAAVPGRTALG
jgi:predicted dehydrogenase